MAEKSPKHNLTRHVRGGWYKSVNGQWKLVAGKREAPTPQAADAVYERKFAQLWADAPQRRTACPATSALLSDLFDQFIHAKRLAVAAGQLEQRTLDDYIDALQSFKDAAGPLTFAELTAHDCTRVHQAWSVRFGVHRLSKFVASVRSCFNWLKAQGFIPDVPAYGDFRQPTRRQFRLHEAKREEEFGSVLFTPAEIAALLDKADVTQVAQVLLAINGGFGNSDLSDLRVRVLDLAGGWIDYRRGKTGVKRRCPLWPETIAAVTAALPKCRIIGNVFSTYDGKPLVKGTHDRLSVRFKTLCERANCYREDRGFYGLRHTFATSAAKHGATIFVKRIMGHTAPEEDRMLDEHYIVGEVDRKLCELSDHVRHELLSEWSSARLATPLPGMPKPPQKRKARRQGMPRSSDAGTRSAVQTVDR